MTFTYEELSKFLKRNPEMICAEEIYALDLNWRPYEKLWGCGWTGPATDAVIKQYPHRKFVSLLCPNCLDTKRDLGKDLEEKAKYDAEMEAGPGHLLNQFPTSFFSFPSFRSDIEIVPLFPPAPNIHIHNYGCDNLIEMIKDFGDTYLDKRGNADDGGWLEDFEKIYKEAKRISDE